MDKTIIIKLSTGKVIELTETEHDELFHVDPPTGKELFLEQLEKYRSPTGVPYNPWPHTTPWYPPYGGYPYITCGSSDVKN